MSGNIPDINGSSFIKVRILGSNDPRVRSSYIEEINCFPPATVKIPIKDIISIMNRNIEVVFFNKFHEERVLQLILEYNSIVNDIKKNNPVNIEAQKLNKAVLAEEQMRKKISVIDSEKEKTNPFTSLYSNTVNIINFLSSRRQNIYNYNEKDKLVLKHIDEYRNDDFNKFKEEISRMINIYEYNYSCIQEDTVLGE